MLTNSQKQYLFEKYNIFCKCDIEKSFTEVINNKFVIFYCSTCAKEITRTVIK